MKLTVLERLILLQTLPGQGDFTTLKIIRKLRESLSFSEEEHKELQFKQEGGQVRWNQPQVQEKNVHIGEKANDIIVQALKKLDEQKRLTEDHYSLYVKFVKTQKED